MKNGYGYTIGFILVLSIVLTTGLALTHYAFTPRIRENRELAEKRAVLDAFGLGTAGSPEEVAVRFSESVRAAESGGLPVYVLQDAAGAAEGIAVPFDGPGLWGSIQGYLAVSVDKREILGIVFTAQNETPGLGGRIDEAAFRDPFRGRTITEGRELTYGAAEGGLDAIAGATSSSNAVLRIVNRLIADTLPGLEVVP